jgi:hypothetical protein
MSSGSDVAKETTVIPTSTLGTRQRAAVTTAALSNQSPPKSKRESPPTSNNAFIRYGEDTQHKVLYLCGMENIFFKVIARCNKALLPSLSKKQVDISKASKSQLLLLAWRTYITMRAL